MLTLGENGAVFAKGDEKAAHGIYKVKAVDTTAAGDTFCGFFIAGMTKGWDKDKLIKYASAASGIAVSRPGAAPSVPTLAEVEAFIADRG